MICERCGGENPEECSFCRHCGHHLAVRSNPPPSRHSRPPAPDFSLSPRPTQPLAVHEQQTACPRCGALNDAHLRYCTVCGTTLPRKETPTKPEGGEVAPAPSAAYRAASRSSGPPRPVAPAPMRPSPVPAGAPPPMPQNPAPAQAYEYQQGYSNQQAYSNQQPYAPAYAGGAAQVSTCWRCQASVPPSAAFCQACGADQRNAAAPAAHTGPPPPARLIVISQDGTPGREYPIEAGQIDVGRTEGGVLLPNDTYVCPRHARIQWKGGRFWASDLGSVNGIYARLRSPEPLHHGSLVLIGLEVLRFELVRPAEQAQSPAIDRGTHVFGSPATPRYARLVQRTVEGVSRNVFYLSKSRTTLGRETGDIVFTEDPFMSRQHAAISREQEGFMLSDLGSSNGTFLAIRDERPLSDGDHVRIGQHLFRLKVDDPA